MNSSVRLVQTGDARPIVQLQCAGAVACILPSSGFNLFDLRLPVGGKFHPILASHPEWAEQPLNPTRNGMPVLFPFPNRIRDARYEFEGRPYALVPNKPPHAIHGFAYDAAWDVIESGVEQGRPFVVGRFQISRHSPSALDTWPADATLEVRYTLSDNSLTLDATVRNPSRSRLPWGLGLHAYFRMPLAAAGDIRRTLAVVPANSYWVLENGIPTGERRPVSGRLDFRVGQPIAGAPLDDVLTDLTREQDGCTTCSLIDENLRSEIRMRVDESFREFVVFTPPWDARAIAVEPYTQPTDAFHLQQRGLDAGLRVLEPGQSAALQMSISSQTV